ncbi:MAG: ABC transporter ATP-binding protein [Elusimicrobiota bacterium]
MLLKFENLSFYYNGAPVLEDISSQIRGGEFLGVIGPNGAGKSTFLKILSRAVLPARGRVFFQDREMRKYSIKQLAQNIAFVSAENFVPYDFTVREIVQMGRTPYLGFFPRFSVNDQEIVERMLRETNILKLAQRSINSLSSGERQRVFIAQAFAQEPKLLLLDEPTNHLDIRYEIEIFKQLKKFNRLQQTTIVVVTHNLNLAGAYCRKLILLKSGRIFAQGSPEEVITENNIRRVYQAEVEVVKNYRNNTVQVFPKTENTNINLCPQN